MFVQLKAKVNQAELDKQIQEAKARLQRAFTVRLSYIGETTVKKAREIGTYTDRTGNLRSSIGYVVSYNGAIVNEDFQQAGSGTDASKGVKESQDLAYTLAAKYKTGYALVIVAGMDYASAVESKNYDVISGAAANLESLLVQAIQEYNT